MLFLFLALNLITDGLLAQTTPSKPAYGMYNNMLVKPKRGHEKQFEQGVKAHNAMFHASGPSKATLAVITE
ncbi:MAG: hypothetical protein WBO31_01510, partial [Saprospiraceae bacterium]